MPVVFHGDGKAEGEHPQVVHGPDADAHSGGAAAEPQVTCWAVSGSYSPSEIESSVCGKNCNDQRQDNEAVVVGAGDR